MLIVANHICHVACIGIGGGGGGSDLSPQILPTVYIMNFIAILLTFFLEKEIIYFSCLKNVVPLSLNIFLLNSQRTAYSRQLLSANNKNNQQTMLKQSIITKEIEWQYGVSCL